MKKFILGLLIITLSTVTTFAQLIVANPSFPTVNDEVVITFNSSLGNGGLSGYTGDMYVHTGVITSASSSGSDWKYVKAEWDENISDCMLTDIGEGLWQITLGPSIRDYYGVPESETILQMAFVFRSDDGTQTGKTEDGSDIYYDVYESSLNVMITTPASNPYFVDLNDIIEISGSSIGADSTIIFVDDNIIFADTTSDFNTSITITESGKHWIVAMAKTLDETAYDSIYYYITPVPDVEEIPEGIVDGINYTSSTSATLCLVAPEKEHIFVIGGFNNWEVEEAYEMKITPDGERFWLDIQGLEAGKEYIFQYLIDGQTRVGDPYADKVSDPWNDKWIDESTYPGLLPYPDGKTSGIATYLQTDQQPYEWQISDFQNPAPEKMVIYELLVRDFIAAHDFQTLIDTLSYLETLGVNVIELMPNSEFEGNLSWGYNPNYYFAPDKYYGHKDYFKAFVDACHERGISVFMDMVLNHAYGTNALALMYWNSAENRPAANNPWFNEESNFTNTDLQWGSDFNHDSEYTRAFVDSVNSYWFTEYKIDGIRFDFTKGFSNNIKTGSDEWGSNYDADRVYNLERMADKIWEVRPDAAVIFEHLADNSEEKELANHGIMLWGNMGFNYNEGTMGYTSGTKSDLSWMSYVKRGWNEPHVVGYMESHDEERLMFKNYSFGNFNDDYDTRETATALKRMELAANFFIPIPGPKMIWQFGERGYDVSIDFNGRVGEKPPKWEYMEDWRRENLYYVYSGLIDLKKSQDVFSTTDFDLDVAGTMKKIRLNSDEMNVVILGNFDMVTSDITPEFQSTGTWYDFWTGDSITVTDINASIELEAGEYRLYTDKKLEKPSNVGINESTITAPEITLYPNPVIDELMIISDKKITSYSVYNLIGSVVSEGSANSTQKNISVQNLKSGYYLIMVETENGARVTKKFIKK